MLEILNQYSQSMQDNFIKQKHPFLEAFLQVKQQFSGQWKPDLSFKSIKPLLNSIATLFSCMNICKYSENIFSNFFLP